MAADIDMNDSPITGPEADAYGFDPFAAALARGIAGMKASAGFVIALDGPWGSGKSSVINLVLHHLRTDVPVSGFDVKTFSPWWYTDAEAMTRGFFETLADAVSGSLKGNAKRYAGKALKSIYAKLRPAKPFIALGGDVAAGGPPVGSATMAVADAAMEWAGASRPLSEEYERLAGALRDHGRRVLIVIDDIDRLDPDGAVLVFQLVKSVGRLPNVLYLLAYDSEVARRQLERRFKQSAAGYLDKIVQATYTIPVPGQAQLRFALIEAVKPVFGDIGTPAKQTRFQNLVHDCVMPWLRTPRDVVRLTNLVTVGWPAIKGEVDAADFLALEALKLSDPGVYGAVQRNRNILCGITRLGIEPSGSKEKCIERCDQVLIPTIKEQDQGRVRIALRRLFPRLDGIYGNMSYGPHNLAEWRRDRRVCSPSHFPAYFRLSPSPETLSSVEIRKVFEVLGDPTRLYALVRDMAKGKADNHQPNTDRLAPIIEALQDRVQEILTDKVKPVLETFFRITSDIDMFGRFNEKIFVDDFRDIESFIWDLMFLHKDQQVRSRLLLDLTPKSTLGWLVEFVWRCWEEHYPESGENAVALPKRMVDTDTINRLQKTALEMIGRAAETGKLIRHHRLDRILFFWAAVAGDEGRAAREWTSKCISDDEGVVRLADAATGISATRTLGLDGTLPDTVFTPAPFVNQQVLAKVCEVERLDERTRALAARDDLAPADKEVLKRYLAARSKQRRSSEN